MEEQIHELKNHVIDSDGVPISKEFPERELGSKMYNKVWKRKPKYDNIHPYMPVIVELCKTYFPTANNILEVGAGFGHLAIQFIDTLTPESYTAYEFSSAAKKLKKRLKKMTCETAVYQDSFRDIENFGNYDCVLALEVFEHIGWDLEFLSKLRKGMWVFFSVPTKHAKNHVRAFLTHESIWKRYQDVLDIHEIRCLCLRTDFPKWWCVAACKL
jgi:2-polyprenyl-3-methyl-5-hydroxy-6-metoxy-1,4-benzoquinol methylase